MSKTMEQLTAAHTGKVLQELRNLIITFKRNGREIGAGMEEFLEYMEGLNLQRRDAPQPKIATKVCPQCEGKMLLYAGDDNDSHWVCQKCRYSIYVDKRPEEVIMEVLNYG